MNTLKTTIAIILIGICSLPAFSAKAVFDITCVETLIANHKSQYAAFGQVKENEAQISALQQQIAEKMVQIEMFQTKFYNSLKSVEAIIKTGKDIIYCADIAKDIGKYQGEMIKLATGNPALLLVSAKTELMLINRTADLMNYVYQTAIIGTDLNLMDNKQRMDLLHHVIVSLREMRGLAYSVCRQMKTAKRIGVVHALAPQYFKYKDTRSKVVDEVLKDFKVRPKR